jgi:NADH dehydrogenase
MKLRGIYLSKQNIKRLVIIGGGYAGVTLVKKLKNEKNIEITLINETPYHIVQTDIHKYLCDEISFADIAFDLEKFTKENDANFICKKVEDIDFNNKEIKMADKKLSYDILVIATGSKSFFPKQIKNIEEYAKDIKEVSNLTSFKEDFLNLVKDKRAGKNIAIVGGGLSGVEIALEFARKLKERNIPTSECSISLIEQQSNVLPNMNPFLVSNTAKACDKLEIKRFHGNFVNEVRDNKIIYYQI